MGNLSHTVGGTDNLVSFKSAARVPIDSLKVHFKPIQEGEGDPSPENVRPIRGWNEVEVYRTSASNLTIPVTFPVIGKNKFNGEISNTDIDNSGQILDSINNNRISTSLISIAHGQYTLSYSENYPVAIYAYDDNGFITNESLVTWQESPTTFVIENAKYVRFKWKKPDDSAFSPSDITNIQLELGSEATAYESYNPDNTIYGGYVDLAKGEVVEEFRKFKFPLSAFTKTEYEDRNAYVLSGSGWLQYRVVINRKQSSNIAKYQWESARNGAVPHFYAYSLASDISGIQLALPKDIDENIDFEFIAELETPIHYPLTPTQLKTFLNNNAFWSNTNDITEVSYAIHDTAPIRAAKKRIMAASPKLETLSSDLVTFNTDVAAPLKECKVYFEPVQEGEGDPSPDNIRPIIGWNELEVIKTGKNMVSFKTNILFANYQDYINGYNGLTDKIDSSQLPRNVQLTYSAYLDCTNTTITENNCAKIWIMQNNGKYRVPEGTIVQTGNAGISYVNVRNISNNDSWFGFGYGVHKNSIVSNPMVEIGDNPTDFEPYNGTTIPITFPTEAGTIYGGYVDLVNGEIIKNWNFYTITGEETFYESGDWVSIFVPSGMQASDDASLRMTGFCSHYPYRAYSRGKIGVMYNERTITFDGSIRDAAGWKTYCQEQYNNGTPITLCYPLRSPIHYPINSQTLKTLRGTNNIWSTSNGPISIKYWKH